MTDGETRWVRAASCGDLAEGETLAVEIEARQIAIYECNGTLYATDDICTHAQARLSDGWLDGETIECPLHAARFDVRSGEVLAPPATEKLKTYAVRVVDDAIEVAIA